MNDTSWALEIVSRAVVDWRRLIEAKAWKKKYLIPLRNEDKVPNPLCNFAELRQFFKGGWCEMILECNNSSVSAEKILFMLERELQEAIEKDNEIERIKL